MIGPLTDHAIAKHVNCQQFETVDSLQCEQMFFSWNGPEEGGRMY